MSLETVEAGRRRRQGAPGASGPHAGQSGALRACDVSEGPNRSHAERARFLIAKETAHVP